ncbi:hypothetical protein BCR42DRAFT_434175 [Absidia repens]|uniref:FH2 domain-containing protein n=1 Tax=Absidia repens TaxID=90262 RepID=A0A1X2ITH5_9FUNG|nr:hypothetical protein BCR42DRAFT_434175 [Absidia repens]
MPLSWIRHFIGQHTLVTQIHIEGDLLKCFKSFLNNRVGTKEAIKHPPCIQQVVNSIISPSTATRRIVCEVLVFLCYFQVLSGQKMVLKTLDQLWYATKGSGRLDLRLKELDTSLNGCGLMEGLAGASKNLKLLTFHGSAADGQLAGYAVNLSTPVPIPPSPPPLSPVLSPESSNGAPSFAIVIKKQAMNEEIRKSIISASEKMTPSLTDTLHNGCNINIAIMAKCKHIPIHEIKQNILAMNEAFCSEILLRNFQLNVPTSEEMGKLAVFLKTASEYDIKNLSKPAAFCATIMYINRFKERIGCMLFKVTFSGRIAQLGQNMSNAMEASILMKKSQAFKDFLSIVLLVGNFLNGTNFQGGAFGIRIDSINKLVDKKVSNNDSTRLHLLISTMERKFGNTSSQLLEDVRLCGAACGGMTFSYNSRVGQVTLVGDKFEPVMSSFRHMAVEKFDQLEERYTSMNVAYNNVVSCFGENPDDMKRYELFSIFKTFTSSWEVRSNVILKEFAKSRHKLARRYEEQRQQRIKQAKYNIYVIGGVSEQVKWQQLQNSMVSATRSETDERPRLNQL